MFSRRPTGRTRIPSASASVSARVIQWAEIVGIVAHTRRDSLEVDENKGVVYTAFAQEPVNGVTFVARSATDAENLRIPMVDVRP